MQVMIDDLLAYARVGRSPGQKQSVDVGVVAVKVMGALELTQVLQRLLDVPDTASP